ncbi:putative transcription factor TGA like domain-containing protein [Helianthus annuus]|uniref:Transcription factor TGA like domain-containing protein n=1 Tax=Helianthus annuus TaxID=4232 RepID=A0A251T575_HELAN|nr:protein DOG1-like 3 [Helianthus annuus]KAF5778962.1 putative transcription factor TGA like domain-containing protein [Helianthus annuus]KAJ0490301.1 putative transcription factor TGA like domain-containing protein [Helianthus annuus]KAJ0494463.1 putative transcription factor TGA like domain-containing protein [Helianthus annuus]KAJ0506219.1 putative transcription factor TGA like domain-containing protein [Helianthus annuus]KAJ0675890.1 putative transcription factor TGA like domain-containin
MSTLPNSRAFMAQAMPSDNPPGDTFHNFFERWLCEQNSYLEELVSAAENHNNNQQHDDAILVPLIHRIVRHYEQYYQFKSNWETRDAISMFTPTWRSKLEDAFLWIGGWRPTLAIHLLYSKSGIQFESKIGDLIRGLTTEDLGELTPNQIKRIDQLQRKTIDEERVLSEKLAKQQESVADRSMVELSNVVSEMIRNENGGVEDEENKVESTLDSKEVGMEELLHRADELRLEMLKAVIEILTPIQAVYFLIAAAELHLRLHEWGKKRETKAVAAAGTETHSHSTGCMT